MAGGNQQPSIDVSEHLSTDDGENINAKRVAVYQFNPDLGVAGEWERFGGNGLVAKKDFDYLSIVNSNTDEDTLTYKKGGSGGTTVQTIVITYTSGATKISDDLSVLTWS